MFLAQDNLRSLRKEVIKMIYECKNLRESILYFAGKYAKETKNSDEWWCKFLNWIKHPDGITVLMEELGKRTTKKTASNINLAYKWLKSNNFKLV